MGEKDSGLTHMQNPADGSDRRRKKKKHPCSGCYYFGGMAESVKCCNYYLLTGKRRQCEAGVGCTVRRNGKQTVKPMKIKNNR